MSAHRQYFSVDPARHTGRRRPVPAVAFAIGLALLVAITAGNALKAFSASQRPQAITEAERLALVRMEAFRAGYQSANESGCSATAAFSPRKVTR